MSEAERVAAFLMELKHAHPDAAQLIDNCQTFYDRRLWHQLTDEVEKMFLQNTFPPGSSEIVGFYDNFVGKFATRINKLRLVQIGRRVSEGYEDPAAAQAFLDGLLKISENDQQPTLFLQCCTAGIQMQQGRFKEAKQELLKVRDALDEIPDADPVVHSALARGFMDFHRSQGTPTEYYKNALLFLNYTPSHTLTPEHSLAIAYELGIAACVGHDVYNFGELLVHPVIGTLKGSPHDWLYSLLVAFNTGSIDAYKAVVAQHSQVLAAQPAIAANKSVLEEKIAITALLEQLFHRPANDRTLTFQDVAAVTQLPISQIEFVLIRGMSLGLLRGLIDGVDQKVHVVWVKPRVLQSDQVVVVRDRLQDWASKVSETIKVMEGQATEIVA